jgi:hypothetical protein
MRTINVAAPDVSFAWLAACEAMMAEPPVAYHTVVRIENPLREDSGIRAGLERILEAHCHQPVSTVANTIFPSAIASSSEDHLELARRYTTMLPTLKRLSPKNDRGTYFGRLIAFPGPRGPVNQLDVIITRLRKELAKKACGTGPLSAAYEAAFINPAAEGADTGLDAPVVAAAQVVVPGSDTRFPGFPCLSHCSFELDRQGRLHALAQYRSQRMVERAYGNYLGLGLLLSYIAACAGLSCGELTVTAGYAELEYRRDVSALISAVHTRKDR